MISMLKPESKNKSMVWKMTGTPRPVKATAKVVFYALYSRRQSVGFTMMYVPFCLDGNTAESDTY